MATTCPVDLDTGRRRDEIRAIYARVAGDALDVPVESESVDFVIRTG
jgi:hypothetical protein